MIDSTDSAGNKRFTEYGTFEDPHFWDPLFASGKLPDSFRNMVDDPKDDSTWLSLWHAYKNAELANEDRLRDPAKVDIYGLLIIKKRVITQSPWIPVTIEEVEAVRRS